MGKQPTTFRVKVEARSASGLDCHALEVFFGKLDGELGHKRSLDAVHQLKHVFSRTGSNSFLINLQPKATLKFVAGVVKAALGDDCSVETVQPAGLGKMFVPGERQKEGRCKATIELEAEGIAAAAGDHTTATFVLMEKGTGDRTEEAAGSASGANPDKTSHSSYSSASARTPIPFGSCGNNGAPLEPLGACDNPHFETALSATPWPTARTNPQTDGNHDGGYGESSEGANPRRVGVGGGAGATHFSVIAKGRDQSSAATSGDGGKAVHQPTIDEARVPSTVGKRTRIPNGPHNGSSDKQRCGRNKRSKSAPVVSRGGTHVSRGKVQPHGLQTNDEEDSVVLGGAPCARSTDMCGQQRQAGGGTGGGEREGQERVGSENSSGAGHEVWAVPRNPAKFRKSSSSFSPISTMGERVYDADIYWGAVGIQQLDQLVKGIHSLDPRTQLYATLALKNALKKSEGSREDEITLEGASVIQADMVPRLVEFLQRDDNPALQAESVCVLSTIAAMTVEDDLMNQKLEGIWENIDEEVIPIFVHLLRSPDYHLREQAMDGFCTIAGSRGTFSLFHHGAMGPLLHHLQNESSLSMLRIATSTLRILCFNCPRFDPFVPALPILAKLVRSADAEVASDAITAVYIVYAACGGEDDVAEAFNAAGLYESIVTSMHHTSRVVKLAALDAVERMFRSRPQFMIDLNVLPVLRHLLSSSDVDLRAALCVVIRNIARGEDQIKAVIEADIIPLLIPRLSDSVFLSRPYHGIANLKRLHKKQTRQAALSVVSAAIELSQPEETKQWIEPVLGALKVVSSNLYDTEPTNGVLDIVEALLQTGEAKAKALGRRANQMAEYMMECGGKKAIEQLGLELEKYLGRSAALARSKVQDLLKRYFVPDDDDGMTPFFEFLSQLPKT